MERKDKPARIQNLNEERFRREILIPLFRAMGFKDVIEYHGGIAEKGKDIIYYTMDDFENKEYTGVVVKANDITGSVSDDKGAMNILFQIKQTLQEGYTDVYNLNKLKIDKCLVITSGTIKNTAIESINGELEDSHLNKLVKFIDIEKLIDLIDKHMPSAFWEEYDYFNKYCISMRQEFAEIKDVSAIGQRESVPLDRIYVSLRLIEPDKSQMKEEIDRIPEKIYEDKFRKEIKSEEIKKDKREFKEKIYDAERAIKEFKKLVLVGVPGSGKTTLLRHLVLKSCIENLKQQERISVPIYISLREFADSGIDLRIYLDQVFEKYQFPEAKEYLEKELNEGKCRLLLDGFDELATKESQDKITQEIHKFSEQYSKNQVIVTSRIAGYHDELLGFNKLELMEFNDQQINRFIENWFGKSKPELVKSMYKAIIENEQIKRLARNPLMIAIIAIIYEEDKRLPQKRAALYERCNEVLLNRWDIQRRIKNKYAVDKKEFILQKLAFSMHQNNQRIISENEVIQLIKKYRNYIGLHEADLKPFLNEIWQRSYLLRQIAIDRYDFLHLSFQEYFTARELKEQTNGLDIIIHHIEEPWWEEPILIYAGIMQDATSLINRIKQKMTEDIFYSKMCLLGKCVADANVIEPDFKNDIIKNLWNLFTKSEFKLHQNKLIRIIRLIKPEYIIDKLIQELQDKSVAVRKHAADTLGLLGSDKAVKPLIKLLKKEKIKSVRGYVIFALGSLGGEQAEASLIALLSSNKSKYDRANAVLALRFFENEQLLKRFITLLYEDKSEYVKTSVEIILSMLKNEKSITPLIELLSKDKSDSVRWHAASVLGHIGNDRAVAPLIRLLDEDISEFVRSKVAKALGMIGSEQAVAKLIALLDDDKSGLRGIYVPEALGEIGSEQAIVPLIKLLGKEQYEPVRDSIVEALGKIGSEQAVTPLFTFLQKEKSESVRECAAETLGKIKHELLVELLIPFLSEDKSESVRERAAEALGKIGNKQAIDILIKLLTDAKSIELRYNAIQALGNIGALDAVQPLKTALNDIGATEFLGTIRDIALRALEKIYLKHQTENIKSQFLLEETNPPW
jgi:HEAT repeat protein/GTPase SAR1 family protein